MTDEYIPAATILLLRDTPDLEVLMVERHADIAFAGGALVFPGGRIDPGDLNLDWAGHCAPVGNIPAEQIGPRIAAIREAFEEAGILFARDGDVFVSDERAKSLDAWRAKIEADDALFIEMIRQEGLTLAIDALTYFARWRPPAHVKHKRFDTWFFAAKSPSGQTAREDGNEATETLWISPSTAVAEVDAGRRKMIFPTRRNVELLGASANTQAALDDAGKRKIEIVQPDFVERENGVFVTIPEDLGYPVTEESIETAFRS